MNIGIIGAGNVGSALATAAVRAGHSVTISATRPESAEDSAQASGAKAAASNREAARASEIVILAIPTSAVDAVIDELGEELNHKVVVDTTNQPAGDFTGLQDEHQSVAQKIQKLAPGARVVKAFNTLFASTMSEPNVLGTQLDAFVAGDDADARTSVMELAESIGFRPIDAGELKVARALEWLATFHMALTIRNGWSWQGGWKYVEPALEPAAA